MSRRNPMRPGTERNRPGLTGCERCTRSFGSVQALLQHLHDKHGEGQLDGEDIPSKRDVPPPACPYCGQDAELWMDSRIVYAKDYGPIWMCEPCGAWVGCHEGSVAPLGRLADKELRLAKQAAHAAFDPIWQAKWKREGGRRGRARGLGYAWLAQQLGIEPELCHIGMFDVSMCERVVEVCRPFNAKLLEQAA